VEEQQQQQLEPQPRQPLAPIHNPQQHHQHHLYQRAPSHPIDEAEEDIEDAEVIVVDTPGRPYESLEEQFTEVDDEFHDSRSTMDIDSEDDDATEPEDGTEIVSSISRTSCIPTSTKLDREELRIVRNNFAEEYDPWDTTTVPEYADDIFRYMRELEVTTPNPTHATPPLKKKKVLPFVFL